MVHVPHDGHNGSSCHDVFWKLFDRLLLNFCFCGRDESSLEAKLLADYLDDLVIEGLVDGDHDPAAEQLTDQILAFDSQLFAQFLDADSLCERYSPYFFFR